LRALCLAALAAAWLLPSAALAESGPCNAPVPDQPVKGAIQGKPFVAGPADIYTVKPWLGHYAGHYLTFTSNDGDERLQVEVLTKLKEVPDGKTFRRLPIRDEDKQPSVGKGATEIQDWVIVMRKAGVETGQLHEDASVTVTFGTRSGENLPGKLAICIPAKHDIITGSFNAKITQ
jgi:hypothetical protein